MKLLFVAIGGTENDTQCVAEQTKEEAVKAFEDQHSFSPSVVIKVPFAYATRDIPLLEVME